MNPALLMLMRSRAAASWTPASLGATLVGWYDPSDSATVTLVDSRVSQLNDKSGNAKHLTQATAANRPGMSTINSLGAILGDGNDFLAIATPPTAGTTWTVLCVATPASSGGYAVTLTTGADGPHLAVISKYNANAFEVYAQSVGSARFALVGSATGAHVTGFRRDGTALTGRYDGASVGSGTLSTAIIAPKYAYGNVVGSSYGYQGSIGEIIICNTALSAGDLAAAESYLKAKWGTP